MIHVVLCPTDQRLAEHLATRFYFHRGSWLGLLAELDTTQVGGGFTVPANSAADAPTIAVGYHADDWATVRQRAWTRAVCDWSLAFQQRSTEGVRVHGHNPAQYTREEELIAHLMELGTRLPAPAEAAPASPTTGSRKDPR